ncbi:MAG: ATP-binding protein [Actinomycetota bacterium]|jgi:anti-sigma regulatory factor (Ser/Thr protein kinase)|nr:ATP-binding protein [Actinomycetota bacterium]
MTPGRPSSRVGDNDVRETLAAFTVASEPGNERRAMEKVADAVKGVGLEPPKMERLKTAVAEATMNAMEHGNEYDAGKPVYIEAAVSEAELSIKITDKGSGPPIPEAETPDIEAKLENRQTPRGWGLFLIESMVDELRVSGGEDRHTVELVFRLGEEKGGK